MCGAATGGWRVGGQDPPAGGGGWLGSPGDLLGGGGRGDSVIETAAKSAVRAIGSQFGREIIRGPSERQL
ncbi:MAG: hypothetical protein AW08_02115 [Candidatus Accumulibacter adjunctus]|uniref:Uncharacterized protein n=1 Tax=Candidatus Accumulibacter adjunctus TaxID=1454001 RepID=A0A011NRW1_9PROT|nr:MAG: hypothetical protein AW08_02115 [Candidatus Accumulibacter adjunctus]